MMPLIHGSIVRLVLVSLSVCLPIGAGCTASQPTRFYVLSASPNSHVTPTAGENRHNVTVEVGPVELPEYVDRPQIVTHKSANAFQLAEFDQWAEPLSDNFSRVLIENLSSVLEADQSAGQIMVFEWPVPMPTSYRVTVQVTQFLGTLQASASLQARWTIFGKAGKEVLVTRQSRFSEPVAGPGYEALVVAMSRTVAALSREIATAITALPQKKPAPQTEANSRRGSIPHSAKIR